MVYDCFPFFNELDVLEIRLNILNDVVDKFVLVEANKTHTGQDKEFIFEQNKERFKPFLDKIIYIKVEDFPDVNTSKKDHRGNRWILENFQRDAIMRGITECKEEDVIIISDCDEIPNPEAVRQYTKGICTLRMYTFLYTLNQLNKLYPFIYKAKICTYGDLIHNIQEFDRPIAACEFSAKGLPTYLRFSSGHIIKKGGWHFTYLITDIDKIIEKRKAIVEGQEFNTTENLAPKVIEKEVAFFKTAPIIKAGHRVSYVAIRPEDVLPEYILKNREKYAHFIKETDCRRIFLYKYRRELFDFTKKFARTEHKYRNGKEKNYLILFGLEIRIR